MKDDAADYITRPEALAELCERLAEADWIAFDTEFVRDRTYFPKLCLMQVADAHGVACVDPLLLEADALEPLLDVLLNPGITKVMHSGEQDLETLFHRTGRVPRNIFDTQIAATLLGHRDQVSYAELVEVTLGVELGKAHTRTNWARRPLEAGPLRYAADDVRYLRQVYRAQRVALEAAGRADWLADDFERLADPARFVNPPEEAWLRVKGRGRLSGSHLAVLQGLAAWREREAMRCDRPRRWILDDETLVDLARALPADEEHGLVRRMRAGRREGILATVRAWRERRPSPLPRGRRISPEEEAEVDRLAGVVRRIAEENGIEPTTLASKRQLRLYVMGLDRGSLTSGWRGALLAPHLED